MAGSLSSLGLGSQGVLSFDIIEKLRAVDDRARVAPIDRSLESVGTKLNDLSTLTTMTASLKSATSVLSDEMSWLKRSSSVSGDSASIDVKAGAAVQNFSIEVNALARRDIIESKRFLSQEATFTTADDTININIDGSDYAIGVSANTTITQLKDEIFDKTNGKVIASILNVGGADPYKLILKSTDTGSTQDITVSSLGSAFVDLGLNDLNKAQNASFTYNNITISRASNSFEDLIVGVSITLNEIGLSSVAIKQNTTDILENLEAFVSRYNELMSNLNEATKFDRDLNASGTFQGVSEIVSMRSMINRQLLSVDDEGRSLANYGVALNSAGMLELDKSIIEEKLQSNPKDVESFFRGVSTADTVSVGVFSKFNDRLGSLISGDRSTLALFEMSLENQKNSFQAERESTIKRLDAKYETMAARFMAYDRIISKLNAQFQSLSMMIEASFADKN